MFDAPSGLKRAFAWNPAWAVRFESLWSLSNKVALLNVVAVADIAEVIGAGRVGQEKPTKIRRFDRLTDAEIGLFLGLPAEHIGEGRPEHLFVKKDRPWLFPKDTLRFCPECLRAGYHSSLHQPHCVKACPVHGVPIENACPSCNKPLPLSPTGQARAEPYACPSCGHRLWKPYLAGAVGSCRNVLVLKDTELGELQALHKWFVLACRAIVCRTDIPRWLELSDAQMGARFETGDISIARQAPYRWGDVLNVRAPNALGCGSTRVDRSGKVRFSSRHPVSRSNQSNGELALGSGEEPEPASWTSPLGSKGTTAIYKSVRRHLRRVFLHRHGLCADLVQRAMWREPGDLESHPVCPWAFAYLYWRRLWERQLHLASPKSLVRRDRGECSIDFAPGPSRQLRQYVAGHVLVLELLGSFDECVLLAKTMNRSGHFSWSSKLFRGRYLPYWAVAATAHDEFTFQWWGKALIRPLYLKRTQSWPTHKDLSRVQSHCLALDI